ncbi:hypothetical protein EJ07DRAFT_172351 [Lizonia empirigonia]|nr:hypothetical protein EJ07DRAFT_172351 [Lizonia empirigonia]
MAAPSHNTGHNTGHNTTPLLTTPDTPTPGHTPTHPDTPRHTPPTTRHLLQHPGHDLIMSFNYDRYDRRQPAARARSTFGYWVPLVLTITVATAGLAAWVWSERRDDDDESDDDDDNLSYGEDADTKTRRAPTNASRAPANITHAPLDRPLDRDPTGLSHPDDLLSRVQGVIRRTPSPQQVFDTVTKKTAAGWAAAGAALASIREEDKDDYGDHSRWSEEAAIRRNVEAQAAQSAPAVDDHARAFAASVRSGPQPAAKRKTVVLVVSAESLMDAHDDDGSYRAENATLLSHLPDTDFATTKLFVLIYSPALRSRPASRSASHSASRSASRDRASPLGSSYSAISTPARTPADELASIDPQPDHQVYTPALSARSSDTLLWTTLHAQALRLVDHPAMVMPFTTPAAFVHMCRHLAPDLVYVVDALSGPDGAHIADLRRWVDQTIVVVGSHGSALAGLQWWETADFVGLGKAAEVVDAARFEDDFERRVGGRE